jgi:hypothetical protein
LSASKRIQRVVIVGLSPKSGVTCKKPLTFLSNQGKMLENIKAGVHKVEELDPQAEHVLLVSSDIPAITGEMVDWVIKEAMRTDEDLYYNVISRSDMEKRFPASKRTYTHLKDIDLCGGDMNVVRLSLIAEETELWEKIINARKSPLKQAALLGFDTLIGILLRQLTLNQAVERVTRRLGLTGRAVLCPYAEVGMDVDKPHQLELIRKDLARKSRKAAAKPTKGRNSAASSTPKRAPKTSKPKPR